MILNLYRKIRTDKSTIGELFIDNKFFCYTLEDKEREVKVYGETAIPKGEYKVVLTMSPRFKRELPLLIGVKGFSGVRIHRGNTDAHTLGCVLVGYSKAVDFIGNSAKCEIDLVNILKKEKEIKLIIS